MHRSMKALLLVTAALAAAAPAWAARVSAYTDPRELDDRSRRWELSAQGAGTVVQGGDQDSSFWLGGGVKYGMRPWASAGVTGGYTSTTTSDSNVDFDIYEFMVEVQFKLSKLRFSPDNPLSPYALAGIGRIWTDTEGNDRSSNAFGWKMGLGVDYHLNNDWAAFFEAAYHKAEDDLAVSGNSEEDNELDFWTFGGGLKRFF